MIRRKLVSPGKWHTLEAMWNVGGTAFFRSPRGAQIKVRYGIGWFGKDRQKQTLDGDTYKKLSVGFWSVTHARLQLKVSREVEVTYVIYPGNVGITTPEIEF